MSIINDALKRAQQNLEKKGKHVSNEDPKDINKMTKTDTPKTSPRSSVGEKKTSHKKKKMWYQTISILVAIFFLVTGILLATLFFLMKRSSSTEGSGEKVRRSYMPKQIQKREYKQGELILSGTSLIENKRVAIINNNIYEQGDIIEGYKISKIELRKVELQHPGGETIILQANTSN